MMGILILLFVGFQRIWHLSYIRADAMICGILRVHLLPASTTFWRYLHSMTIIQSQSLLRLSGPLRERVWRLCAYRPMTVTVNIDTTVSTVYGQTEGMGKMPNKKHLGKPSLRPVLCFLGETREFLCGSQRRGYTMSGADIARLIGQFRGLVPTCVRQIRVHGDGEFMAIECIKACENAGHPFTFANRRCTKDALLDSWTSLNTSIIGEDWRAWPHNSQRSSSCTKFCARTHSGNKSLGKNRHTSSAKV